MGEGLSWFCSVQAIFLLFLTSKCQFSLDITNKSKFTSLFVCSCGLLAKYGRSVYTIDILNPPFLTCFSFFIVDSDYKPFFSLWCMSYYKCMLGIPFALARSHNLAKASANLNNCFMD